MLFLATQTDKVQLVTSAAVAVDVHCSFADNAAGTITEGKQNTAISTATTTDILAAPGASTIRKLKLMTARNKGAANVDVTVVFDQNGTDYELHKATLSPNQTLQYLEGTGFVKLDQAASDLVNSSIADQGIGASATAYLTGSNLNFPRTPVAGCILRWLIAVGKSGAATATEAWSIRFGTTGTTSDTARCTFTGDTETAVADEALVLIHAIIRGPIGASCVVQGQWVMDDNLTTTGFSNTARKAQVRVATSAAFDITPAGTIAGLVLVTGASHSITVRSVIAECLKL